MHAKVPTKELKAQSLKIAQEAAALALRFMTKDERKRWVEGLSEPVRSAMVEWLKEAGLY